MPRFERAGANTHPVLTTGFHTKEPNQRPCHSASPLPPGKAGPSRFCYTVGCLWRRPWVS
jgi:hypothetical protein